MSISQPSVSSSVQCVFNSVYKVVFLQMALAHGQNLSAMALSVL